MALLPTTPPGMLALALIVAGLALARWRRYPMSYAMALVCIGVFVVQLASLGFVRCRLLGFPLDCVMAELSFIAPLTAEGQRITTPFTYMFVHADVLHIVGNMFILLTAGPALEERIGTRNFTLLYIAAGLGAAAATVGLWQVGFFQGGQENSPNVGASGAIFGVLTGFALLYPRERLPMIMPLMPVLFWMPSFTVLLLHLAFNVVYFVTAAQGIAWWGHLAGFVVGVALAPALRSRIPARRMARSIEVDAEALRPLATTNVQRSALRELERLQHAQTPDDRRMAEMWWERFVARAACPVCGRKLGAEGARLVCPTGDYEVAALKAS